MGKRINLFKKQESFGQLDEKLKKLNFYGVIFTTVLLVIFLSFFVYNLYLSKNITKLSTQKESLVQQLNQDNTQFKINYISNKTDQIKKYDKNDAHFTAYYDLLKNALQSNSTPVFSSFKIDSKRNIEMDFNIDSYDTFQKILSYTESDDFLKYFNTLNVQSASYSQSGGTSQNVLQLTGVAKNVNTEI
jgi:DNA-dependent RNA polymerase auxiliary subunit epsilon